MSAIQSTRCILLTSSQPSSQADDPAQHLLQNQWEVIKCVDPLHAMAELALSEHGQAARAAWGLSRAVRTVLAISWPETCPHLKAMLTAVGRYFPNVTICNCSNSQLKPLPLSTPPTSPPRDIPADPSPQSPADSTTSDNPSPASKTERATLSREELDMLLETQGDEQ